MSNVYTKQQRIAQLAAERPGIAFTTLAHHMDMDWLREACSRVRKDGASGIDNQSAKDYAEHLEGNLQSLLDRAKSGSYHAPPVRRVHIPKGDGSATRPIGIPTVEDKVLQRAVVMLMEPIYEAQFSDCSFGFRPGRGAHGALGYLWEQARKCQVRWVLDVDIKAFFDTIPHDKLRDVISQRVRDGVVQRLIGKWLKAGVMEGGQVSYAEEGTPQGGVISPLLANIYLHEVIDEWFAQIVQPRLRGRSFLVRYADDFVMGFEHEEDAKRVFEVLPKRLAKYGLSHHPEKTRLVPFERPARVWKKAPQGVGSRRKDDEGQPPNGPGVFDFLGFTHYWGKSREGHNAIKRKTSKKRLNRGIKSIGQWCRDNRHEPVREQWQSLKSKLRGHYAYYGITGNWKSLVAYLRAVERRWREWLGRRSTRSRVSWEAMLAKLSQAYPLPQPRIVHSIIKAKQ